MPSTRPDARPNLLAVGSIAFDSIRTPSGRAPRILGGSAVYFSAAARLFTPVKIIGVVGTDFPRTHLRTLGRLGVDTSGVVTGKGKTFFWKGYYEADLSQAHTQKTELNVFSDFKPVLSARDRSAAHLFLANISPDLQLSVLSQISRPRWTACDTMNYWITGSRERFLQVLGKVDISFMNDAEIRQLSGHSNLIQAGRWVLKRGPSLVIIKKGEHGVLCLWRKSIFLFPACLVEEVKDPTGAGDSFAGAFLGNLARHRRIGEKEIKSAIAYGAVVASFNVQSFGPERLLRLKETEIAARFRLYRKMISID